MIRKIALLVSMLMVFAIAAYSEQPAEPETGPAWIEFEHGKYLIGTGNSENVLIILPDQPMMKDRLGKYGDVTVNPKTNERSFNTQDKSKVTEKGLEVYDLLSRMETLDKWFAYSVVVLNYDKVTCIKYNRTKWDQILEKTLAAFK